MGANVCKGMDTRVQPLLCFSYTIKPAMEELRDLLEKRKDQQDAYIPKLRARIDKTDKTRQQYEQKIETTSTKLEDIRATIIRLRTRRTQGRFDEAIQESERRLQQLTTGLEQLRAQLSTWTAGREPGQLPDGISVQVRETQEKIREMETEMADIRTLLSTKYEVIQEIGRTETLERLQVTKYRALNDLVPRLSEALQKARETIASEYKSLENSNALLLWLMELLVDADKLQEPKYKEDIRNKIRPVFVEHINPDNVLQYFHAVNIKVLTQNDIDRVQATTGAKGRSSGAAELLALLPYYQDWEKCLLAVLRLPEVKLDHVAKMLEDILAEVDTNPTEEETQPTEEENPPEDEEAEPEDEAKQPEGEEKSSENEELVEAQRMLGEKQAEIENLKRMYAQVTQERDKYKLEIDSLKAERDKNNSEITRLEAELRRTTNEAANVKNSLEKRISDLDKEREKLTQTIEEQNEEIEKAKHFFMQNLLASVENESLLLFKYFMRTKISDEHAEFAQKYDICRPDLSSHLMDVAAHLFGDIFFPTFKLAQLMRDAPEINLEKAKRQVGKIAEEIKLDVKRWKDKQGDRDKGDEAWCNLKRHLSDFFHFSHGFLMTIETQSVTDMREFMTWCQDTLGKELHPALASLGGWTEIMQLTEYDKGRKTVDINKHALDEAKKLLASTELT